MASLPSVLINQLVNYNYVVLEKKNTLFYGDNLDMTISSDVTSFRPVKAQPSWYLSSAFLIET